MSKKVGILTGGGDCPGLNPAIRAVVRTLSSKGYEVFGFKKGWHGPIANETMTLDMANIDKLLITGGTCLGSSRTNPYNQEGGVEAIKKTFKDQNLHALVAIGGEDTMGVAHKLSSQENLPIVGIPKTIDNDLDATDMTLGFQTAVQIACDAIDRLKTTAESHDRVMVVEIMGRHAGWLTAYAGLAGGADCVITPEFPMEIDEVCKYVQSTESRGKNYAIIAVAEGAKILNKGQEITSQSEHAVDSFGHVQLGGIGDLLKNLLKEKTGRDVRSTNLGHIQRGGTPTAMDRVLSTSLGLECANNILKENWGMMSAFKDGKIQSVTLADGVGRLKTLSEEFYSRCQAFFG
ncbi:MAG: ATP-dependent 6-phosphofructokinase [Deltaproteobacteria bacterium]|nr:ATP-dependent 6-phosphofructokinase [Deltaproteobacteria bacterium]